MIDFIRTFAGGFFMGGADLVPGVSGGTIALVLGIYERLVGSIREGSSALGALLKLDFARARDHLQRVEWSFLIPLLVGIGAAVVALASLIEHQLDERPTVLAGLFLGLVVVSVVIAWRRIKAHTTGHWLIAAVVAAVLFTVLGFGESAAGSDPALLAFFGAGALAICAMILPGISGSLILLMIGMYSPVLGAVTDRDFGTILVFGAGAIFGLALFSQALHWALAKHHDNVMSGLVGLMAGSTRVLWPWPDGVDGPDLALPGDDVVSVGMAFVLGAVFVWAIARLARGD